MKRRNFLAGLAVAPLIPFVKPKAATHDSGVVKPCDFEPILDWERYRYLYDRTFIEMLKQRGLSNFVGHVGGMLHGKTYRLAYFDCEGMVYGRKLIINGNAPIGFVISKKAVIAENTRLIYETMTRFIDACERYIKA